MPKTAFHAKLTSSVDKESELVRLKQRLKLFLLGSLIGLLLLPIPAFANPKITQKKQELDQVQQEIAEIDDRLEEAVEDYNEARYKLAQTQNSLAKIEKDLAKNQAKLRKKQSILAYRWKSLYMHRTNDYFDFILGSRSFSDFIERWRLVIRVATLDANLVEELKEIRAKTVKQKQVLKKKRELEESIVNTLAEKKKTINRELAQRKTLASSIKDEIAQLARAEERRQARLRAQLRARTVSQYSAPKQIAYRVSRGAPRSSVVEIALQQLGKPYSWGAAGPYAFDCSGLVVYCFAQLGISLPHSSRVLYGMGTPISYADLQPGDLVFFARGGRVHHVGIYVGSGNFIHAPHSGAVVSIAPLSSRSDYAGARRI